MYTDDRGFLPDAVHSSQQAQGERHRHKATGNRQQATGNRQQAKGKRQKAKDKKQKAKGKRQKAKRQKGKRQKAKGKRQKATFVRYTQGRRLLAGIKGKLTLMGLPASVSLLISSKMML